MNVTMRKVVSIVVGAALVAGVAATVAAPAYAKKPEGKDQKTTFTMEAQIYWAYPPNWFYGEGFRAKGAIRDSGSISLNDNGQMFPLTLVGKRGSLYIESDGGLFVIADATGDHADAIGATGSVAIVSENISSPDSLVLERMYYLTFEGSLAP
jgi:hypothetical protein